MTALTLDQLELLQRAQDGVLMWGGSVATYRLRREVDLLIALRLVEPAGAVPYRLTQLGALVLATACVQSSSCRKMPPNGSRAGGTQTGGRGDVGGREGCRGSVHEPSTPRLRERGAGGDSGT